MRVSLDDGTAAVHPSEAEVLDLDAALTRFATIDPRKSRVAELRAITITWLRIYNREPPTTASAGYRR